MARSLAVSDKRPLRWIIAVAWSVWIVILLLQPEANPLIDLGLPSGPQTLAREAFFTALHVIAFAVTCALWFWAWQGQLSLRASLAVACGIALALGVATEYLQTLSPDRHPSFIDLAANIVGISLAALLIWRRQNTSDHPLL